MLKMMTMTKQVNKNILPISDKCERKIQERLIKEPDGKTAKEQKKKENTKK